MTVNFSFLPPYDEFRICIEKTTKNSSLSYRDWHLEVRFNFEIIKKSNYVMSSNVSSNRPMLLSVKSFFLIVSYKSVFLREKISDIYCIPIISNV